MELLLKRGETKKALRRTKYELFAKLELTPEEQILIKKAQTDKTLLTESDQTTTTRQWRKSLLGGAVLAIILGLIVGAFMGLLWFWLVAPLAWLPLSKLVFNQIREAITVKDLLTGRTIRSHHMGSCTSNERIIGEAHHRVGYLPSITTGGRRYGTPSIFRCAVDARLALARHARMVGMAQGAISARPDDIPAG